MSYYGYEPRTPSPEPEKVEEPDMDLDEVYSENSMFKTLVSLHLQPNVPLERVDVSRAHEPTVIFPSSNAHQPLDPRTVYEGLPTGETVILPLTEEEIGMRSGARNLAAGAEITRRLMASHLEDRVRACAPDVNAKFDTLRDAWTHLHPYHVFDVDSVDPGQVMQCESLSDEYGLLIQCFS